MWLPAKLLKITFLFSSRQLQEHALCVTRPLLWKMQSILFLFLSFYAVHSTSCEYYFQQIEMQHFSDMLFNSFMSITISRQGAWLSVIKHTFTIDWLKQKCYQNDCWEEWLVTSIWDMQYQSSPPTRCWVTVRTTRWISSPLLWIHTHTWHDAIWYLIYKTYVI